MSKRKLKDEWTEVICNYFENECIYCGSSAKLRIHHIIPRFLGGKNVLSNLELVCFRCHCKLHKKIPEVYPRKDMKKFGNVDRMAKAFHSEL
jgi:5-methylcytosine-specific restriction endonuclease McrA